MTAAGAFAFLLALMALGLVLARSGAVDARAHDALNKVTLYICLPAAVLLAAPKMQLSAATALIALIPWLLAAVSVAVVLLAARLFRWDDGVRGVLLLALPLGNTSFLGYPVTAAFLGEGALPDAVIYDQLGSFVLLSTYGLAMIAWSEHGKPPPLSVCVKRMMSFPPFLALLFGVLVLRPLFPDGLPPALDIGLRKAAEPLLTLVGLALGMQLKFRLPRPYRGALVFGVAAKMLLLPLIAWGLAHAFGLAPPTLRVVVLEAAMPTMITAMALAAMAGLAPELASALVGYGVLLAMASLPAWVGVVGGG